jgi:hypothetical protein
MTIPTRQEMKINLGGIASWAVLAGILSSSVLIGVLLGCLSDCGFDLQRIGDSPDSFLKQYGVALFMAVLFSVISVVLLILSFLLNRFATRGSPAGSSLSEGTEMTKSIVAPKSFALWVAIVGALLAVFLFVWQQRQDQKIEDIDVRVQGLETIGVVPPPPSPK